MLWLAGSMATFFAGALLSFVVTNSIRTKQIENIRQELRLERQEKERVQALLKQCETERQEYIKQYADLQRQIKQKEIDYARKVKEYAERARQIRIAERYNLQAEGKDECERLKNLLDKLMEVEK